MQTIDLTPLYRTLVGFDRISSLIDQAQRLDATGGYPPYNIEQVREDAFRIELAVAGFSEDELTIELKDNLLTVQGKRTQTEGERRYLHRGIAERSFERRFQLADHVLVTGAALSNGLLRIELVRQLPESAKPRRIAINGEASAKAPVIDAPVSPANDQAA